MRSTPRPSISRALRFSALATAVSMLGLGALQASAQTAPPVDAGQLLEQQRRQEQQPAVPAQPSQVLREPSAALGATAPAGEATFSVRSFDISGNTRVETAALQAALAPWLARPVALSELRRAAAAVEQLYRRQGWLAQATLPPQDITAGQVRLQINEARMGRVQISTGAAASGASGSPGASAEPAARALPASLIARVQALLDAKLPAGEPLALADLERALLLANDLADVRASGSLQASAEPGRTDVLLQLQPAPLWRGELSADNAANRATGSARVGATAVLQSPWGFGEQLVASTSLTQGIQYLRAGGLLPVGNDGWRVGANFSALQYRVLGSRNTSTGDAPEGSTTTFSAEAQYPLRLTPMERWTLGLGAEQRRQRNRDDVRIAGQLETTSATQTGLASVSLGGYRFDEFGGGGQNQFYAQLSRGSLSLDGSGSDFLQGDAATVATQGGFTRLRYNAGRTQRLSSELSLTASFSGQWASKNLDPADKFYLGGFGALNAYPSGEAGGASGQLLNLELRRSLGAAFSASVLADVGRVQLYADNRRADGNGPIVPDNSATLKGLGLSAGWRGQDGLQLRAVLARRVGSNPLATASGNDTDGSLRVNRLWLSASQTF